MRALVVFESMFGNTETIARAIAEGLSAHMRVAAVEVGAAPATVPDEVGLLPTGVAAAAFDTRVDRPRLPGSAARAAEKRLQRLGVRSAAPAESFYVRGSDGPLVAGERERARRWGDALGAALRPVAPQRP